MINRSDRLNNELWSIIESRKDEALSELERLQNTGWIDLEMKKLIKQSNMIVRSEINKFNVIYKIIVGYEPQQVVQLE